jgi:hypothetical protein
MRKALRDAQERARALRQRALDFHGPDYYPDEWKAAESRFTQAEALKPESAQAYQAALDQYTALGDTYEGIGTKAIPRYKESRDQALQIARDEALEAGAAEALSEALDQADKTAQEALGLYEGQDYYAFARESAQAEALYTILKIQGASMALRSEIETYTLNRFDPPAFAAAEEALHGAMSAYEAKDSAAAQVAAEKALSAYEQVAAAGWEALAEEQRQRAYSLREEAMNLKAPVAMQEAYEEADGVYTQGEQVLAGQDFKQAFQLFTQGADQFTIVRDATIKKRQGAEKAIKTARDKITDSDKRAKSAQAKLGGMR